MKRNTLFLAGSVIELLRFAALTVIAAMVLDFWRDAGSSLLFRAMVAPQLLFTALLFFLWRDETRYEPFRALITAGKALCALSEGYLAFVWIISVARGIGSRRITPGIVICLCVLTGYDLASALYCALARRISTEPVLPEPTVISLDGMPDGQG